MTNANRSIASKHGFALIELMLALTIGLLLVLAVGEVYLSMRKGQSTVSNVSDVQENARFISERIKRDVRIAGHLGSTYQRWSASETAIAGSQMATGSNECFQSSTAGASFRWAVPVPTTSLGDPPPMIYGSDSATPFSNCISGNLVAASDVLSVHYAGPTAVASGSLKGPQYYIQTSIRGVFGFFCPSGTVGTACLPSDSPASSAGAEYYPLVSRLYYVRDYARAAGDGIPTLVVTELTGSSVQTQPLVEGVAVFQTSFGIDNDGNGSIDIYRKASEIGDLSAANLPTWNRVKTVELRYVLRGIDIDSSRLTSADRTYSIGGTTYTVSGQYLSREFKITAALRNPNDRQGGV